MTHVEPIPPFSADHHWLDTYARQLLEMAPQQKSAAASATPAAVPQPEAEDPAHQAPDAAGPQQGYRNNKKYLTFILNRMIWRARQNMFIQKDYNEASKHYGKYMRYMHYYWSRFPGQFNQWYVPLFEYMWAQDLNHKQERAEAQFNRTLSQLSGLIERETNGAQEVTRFLRQRQANGQLPGGANKSSATPVNLGELHELALILENLGRDDLAENVLAMVEIHQRV
ncbi:MAG: hypothetical protein KTR14_05785, partial [Vampirovibrio sp.]|nr:hypothetical protein [Vampirovibrio sp.]